MSLYCLRQHVGRVFFQAFCQVICQMFCFLLGSAAKLFWTACLSNVFWTCFFLEAHYSLEALGFVLAARCLHYPFIACCPLLAISFNRLLPHGFHGLSWCRKVTFADSCMVSRLPLGSETFCIIIPTLTTQYICTTSASATHWTKILASGINECVECFRKACYLTNVCSNFAN